MKTILDGRVCSSSRTFSSVGLSHSKIVPQKLLKKIGTPWLGRYRSVAVTKGS